MNKIKNKKSFSKKIISDSVAIVIVALSANVSASPMLEEVVVTAQKRAQSLQDVPISVTAVSGDKMKDAGITDLQDLSQYTPNISINQGASTSNVFIRGIGSGTNAGFEQSVGIYVDGVYSGRGALARVPFMMDMERVEVLKGPQGILFGKNTIGGAINVTSAKPTESFEGYVDAIYAPEDNEQVYTAAISGPLSDNVSGRLTLRQESMDGWLDNESSGATAPNTDNTFVRGAVQWLATDTLQIDAKFEHGDFSVDEFPQYVYQSDQPTNADGNQPFPVISDGDNSVMDFGNANETVTDVFALTVEQAFDAGTLTSITAYSGYQTEGHEDADKSAVAALHRTSAEDFKQYSQELRFTSPGGETIDWLVGAYAQQSELNIQREIIDMDFALLGPLSVTPLIQTNDLNGRSDFDQQSTSYAFFGQSTWNISDSFAVTGGLRYNQETKTLDKVSTNPNIGASAGSIVVKARPIDNALIEDLRSHSFTDVERDESHVSWSLNAQWFATDDTMFYASSGTGFKGGGFDEAYSGAGEEIRRANVLTGEILPGDPLPGNDASILAYEEESVLSFEIGSKMTLADGAATLNVALFHNIYDDLQVSSLIGDAFRVSNAGKSISQGVELDGRWALTDNLTIGGAIAYLDAYYDEFENATCTVDQAAGNDPGCEAGSQDLSGETLVYSPDLSANANVNYDIPLANGMLIRTGVDVNYTDEFYSALDLDANTLHDSAVKWNARIALDGANDDWTVAVIGKNLTNEKTDVWKNDVPLSNSGSYFAVSERPRSVAVQGQYRF
ncbi:Vitamin B12 transporter BtuB [Sinobacterium norvegicum]|uniref:Vitamin B12 transporter BtuB n=1 Tax=Sinobacterium norvegicum TaxID=1641715 RepID=A0ABN8EK80_9GAMM|nr:TonB-dependent receptor [Sinobacterium norvegicum]CAH0991599.1 Vitamin B12 transporter BtuB [Sinobacterium norvegicum]